MVISKNNIYGMENLALYQLKIVHSYIFLWLMSSPPLELAEEEMIVTFKFKTSRF